MPAIFGHIILHFCVLGVVGRSLAARAGSSLGYQQQNQLSSSDGDFKEVHADPSSEWVGESPAAKYHATHKRHQSSIPSTPYYYLEHGSPDSVRPTDTHKMYIHRGSGGGGLPQKNVRPWLSEYQTNDIRPNPNLHDFYYKQVYGQSWGPDQSKLAGWGWTSNAHQTHPYPHKQYRGTGGGVNYAAVSLLSLLALMGTIQHVMTELDFNISNTINQSQNDFETANSISNGGPGIPLRPTNRPTQRPVRPPTRPPFTTTTTRPTNNRPTQQMQMNSSRMPFRHKKYT